MNIKKSIGIITSFVLLIKLYFTPAIDISVELRNVLFIIGVVIILIAAKRREKNA